MQPLDVRLRVDAELVGEPPAPLVVVTERLGAAADPGQGQHELTDEPFAGGVDPRGGEKLVHDALLVAEPQFQVEEFLGGGQAGGLQPLAEGRAEFVGDVSAQYRPPPQVEGPAQGPDGGVAVPLGAGGPDQGEEVLRVDRLGRGLEQVAAAPRTQAHRRVGGTIEDGAQFADPGLHDGPRLTGWRVAPEQVDQLVGRDQLVGAECEDAEDQPLLAPGETHRGAGVPHLHRSQYANFHPTPPRVAVSATILLATASPPYVSELPP